MEVFIKSFIIGYAILIVAVLLNFLALQFGIKTWNEFLTRDIKIHGINALVQLSLVDIGFLFIIYPLLLGFTAFIIYKL